MSQSFNELMESPLVKAILDKAGQMGVPTREWDLKMIRAAKGGDAEAREQIMIRHSPFVVSEVKKMGAWGIDYTDLFQEGMVGLNVAVDRFDPDSYENRFISYAVWWVRQAMLLSAQNSAGIMRVPVNRHTSLIKIRRLIASGRNVDVGDVCRMFKITAPVARALLDAAIYPVSLNALPASTGDEGGEIGDILGATFNDDVADADEVEWARKMIESDHKMTPRQKRVVVGRLFDGRTLEDISTDFGVSRERIRQIELEAMSRVRKLAAQYDERCGFTRGDRRSMLTIGGNA